jgi:ABC-type sugar transport system permease subunit
MTISDWNMASVIATVLSLMVLIISVLINRLSKRINPIAQ